MLKKVLTAITALAVVASLLAGTAGQAAAVSGYDSAYFGESAFLTLGPGQSGQFAVGFNNTGSTGWLTGSASQTDPAESKAGPARLAGAIFRPARSLSGANVLPTPVAAKYQARPEASTATRISPAMRSVVPVPVGRTGIASPASVATQSVPALSVTSDTMFPARGSGDS